MLIYEIVIWRITFPMRVLKILWNLNLANSVGFACFIANVDCVFVPKFATFQFMRLQFGELRFPCVFYIYFGIYYEHSKATGRSDRYLPGSEIDFPDKKSIGRTGEN